MFEEGSDEGIRKPASGYAAGYIFCNDKKKREASDGIDIAV
jgi:hypothetical protein